MNIGGKEITDECVKCGKVLDCELFRRGHGIGGKRENIREMVDCQMRHKEEQSRENLHE